MAIQMKILNYIKMRILKCIQVRRIIIICFSCGMRMLSTKKAIQTLKKNPFLILIVPTEANQSRYPYYWFITNPPTQAPYSSYTYNNNVMVPIIAGAFG